MPLDFMQHMSPIEARVGIIQISKYQDIVYARRKYAAYYRREFHNSPMIKMNNEIEASTHSQIIALIDKREQVLVAALKMGVQFGIILEYCMSLFDSGV